MTSKISQAKATKSAQFIAAMSLTIEKVSYSAKTGEYTAKRSFFYKFGNTAEKFAIRVHEIYGDATITQSLESWNAWPKTSYFVAKFTMSAESLAARAEAVAAEHNVPAGEVNGIVAEWKASHA